MGENTDLSDVAVDHDRWRIRLLRRAIIIVFLGSALTITLWVSRSGTLDGGAVLGTVLSLALISSLHPSFSWKVKAAVLVANLTLVGMYFPLLIGVRYTALAIAGAGILVGAAFFGRRIAFALIILDTIGILAFGIWAQKGIIHPPDVTLPGDTIFMTWAKAAVVFATVGSLLAIMIGGFVDSLEKTVEKIQKISNRSQVNELKFRRLIDYAPDAIVLLDAGTGKFVEVNSQAEKLFGYTAIELKNFHPLDVSPEFQENGEPSSVVAERYIMQAIQGEIPVFEWLHLNKDGERIACEIRLLRLPAEDAIHVRGSITDIRERKKQQAIIQSLALYDNLTGLPNRKLFQDRLGQALAASERDKQYGAVFFIDIDNFKNINDTSGHASGDYFLTVVAERIQSCVRATDTVARWGGDEFVVVTENLSGSLTQAGHQAEKIGEKILDTVGAPIANPYTKGQNFQNSVSVGITLLYGHIHTPEELLKRSDIAMYQAKLAGKNRLRNFDVEMQKQIEARLALEADLKLALRRGELELLFQPQYNSQRIVFGAEVLLRWRHPDRGMVYPGDFIPVAEDTGDIIEIGKWIIRMACVRLQEWQEKAETKHLALAINVSPKQFRETGFTEMVSETVRDSGIDPSRLKFELTESLMLEDVADIAAKMEMLRTTGVGFCLDDFGTGYSSLAYLKRLPFSQLKIDQSFVRDLTTDSNDATLIKTIIGMADNLALQVIAEGVETQEQFASLYEMGCQSYQGYFFSRPVTVQDFEKLIY